ncbi:MAG: hypothetical protein QXV17_09795 [Candidatus Micrarchaeaceae archaeon]
MTEIVNPELPLVNLEGNNPAEDGLEKDKNSTQLKRRRSVGMQR